MKEIRINNFKEKLFYEKLSNGLEVFLVPLKQKSDFTTAFVVKYGGRDIFFKVDGKLVETKTGIAHFLEHKMFEKEEDPFKFYQKYGIDVNASTSHDFTNYYILGNKNYKKSLEYLLNWLQSLNLTSDLVKKEQGIILEEASMYKDIPDRVLNEKIKENVFTSDPYRYKVIGKDEDILSITKEELELCYKSFYTPNNMFLISVGNFNPHEAIEIIKENTKNFQNSSCEVTKYYPKEEDKTLKKYEEIFLNVDVPRIGVAYKINKQCFKELKLSGYKLDLYLHMLINIGLGLSSDIREKWLNEKLFINSLYRVSENDTHYVIEFYAVSKKPDILKEELQNYLKDIKISSLVFERQKKLWIANEVKSIGNINAIKYNIIDDVLDYGKFIPNKIEIIKSLEFEILEKIKDAIDFTNEVTVKILPKDKKI